MKIRETRKVYFAQAGQDGPIKIGCTSVVRARIADLQWATGQKLRLLGTLTGGYLVEHRIQRLFKHLLIGREWFWPQSDLLAFIKSETSLP